MKMAEWEELSIFLVWLASEIIKNKTRGFQNVGHSFTNQLAGLLTVISAHGVSQVVISSFGEEPTKFRDLIEKYMLLAGGDDNQSKRLAYQTGRGAVSDYIQSYMGEYPENNWEQIISELSVRFAEVNDIHHDFTMLCKAR